MTEEELASAHLCRAGEERERRIARDAAMNEAQLNSDHLHRAWEESRYR